MLEKFLKGGSKSSPSIGYPFDIQKLSTRHFC